MNYDLGKIIDFVKDILDQVFAFFKGLSDYAKAFKKDEEAE